MREVGESVGRRARTASVFVGAVVLAATLGAAAPASAADLAPDSVTACQTTRPMLVLTQHHDTAMSTMNLTFDDTNDDGVGYFYVEWLLDGQVYNEAPFEWARTDINWQGVFTPELAGQVQEVRLYSITTEGTKADLLCSTTVIHKLTGRP